ncbi:MAG: tryptophanase [Cyanobacteriota bacterium]
MKSKYIEPFKIKVVEPISQIGRKERELILEKAGYNLFSVPADKVMIDLLTDSGTSAMSDNQWAGLMMGDESYAGSRNYYHFEETIQDIFGYKYVIPTHQGRVAENILCSIKVKKGHCIPNNIHFDTTRANIEHAGAKAVNCVIDEAYDTGIEHPFKGNMDLNKLEKVINEVGPENIPFCMITITNNSGGGQPVSLENIKQTKALVDKYNLPLLFDACRFAENAYFIKTREKAYEDWSIKEIAKEMFKYGNGCTMSAKKDGLVNIGGFLCLDNEQMADKVKNLLILVEGFPTYGGLAGRDLEAVARGLKEVLDENYLSFRIGQIKYLGDLLDEANVPYVKPTGGHAIYIDVKKFLPEIPQSEFPAQALVCELYLAGGIRSVEIGSLMFGYKDKETGEDVYPNLELLRLAIPRRVYTTAHIEFVAQTIIDVYNNKEKIKGLKLIYEADILRHFTAKLAPIES